MPKTAIDYSKTQMYKLKHKDDYDDENIYIGHTTNWIQRKTNHKRCCNTENSKEYNAKNYKFIRENGGWEEWEMVLIENYPCNNNIEARAREEMLRCNFNTQLNTVRALRTKEKHIELIKAYYEDHKEEKKKYNKEYRSKFNNNLEIPSENKKKEKITCECGCIIARGNIIDHIKTKKHINALVN